MTKEELLQNIDQAITSKTEINSITPQIHGETLKAVVEWLHDGIVMLGISPNTITDVFASAPQDYILPSLGQREAKIYFVSKSGNYHTAKEDVSIDVEAGERVIIKFNGQQWEKIGVETLVQDIAGQSREKAVSQYAVKQIFDLLNETINNISSGDTNTIESISLNGEEISPDGDKNINIEIDIPTKLSDLENDLTDSDTKNTAGNSESDDLLYITGVKSISETDGDAGQTFVNKNDYIKNGVIFGEVNNYRYMKNGIWNTLGGNVIKDLYGNGINAEISDKDDTEYLEQPETTGTAYLRVGRIFAEKESRGYNTTFILHVHSQRNTDGGHYGNGFTVFVNKSNGSDKVNITPLFLNNDASTGKAGMKFNKLLTKQVNDFDGLDGIDILVEFEKGEVNNAICASALMLSDAADLYQGEKYTGCFEFTYNIELQKEYIKAHAGCKITGDSQRKINKSALYISKKKPENCEEYTLTVKSDTVPTKTSDLINDSGFLTKQVQSDWDQTDNTEDDFIKNKPTIPENVSDLNQDVDYATKDDLKSFVPINLPVSEDESNYTDFEYLKQNTFAENPWGNLYMQNINKHQVLPVSVLYHWFMNQLWEKTTIQLSVEKEYGKLVAKVSGDDGIAVVYNTAEIYWNGVCLFPDKSFLNLGLITVDTTYDERIQGKKLSKKLQISPYKELEDGDIIMLKGYLVNMNTKQPILNQNQL